MKTEIGPYQIQERLAVGGLAEIFLARKEGMLGFEQRYALKVLLPQYADSQEHRKLMIDEARLTAQLDHPNIIKVHDLLAEDDTLVMVMEYVNGLDLSTLLARLRKVEEPVPIPVAIWVAQEICAGLHYAHTRTDTEGNHLRIVHRDVSPQNVLLGYGGEVKIIDFGVAKAAGAGRMETKTGIIKGKLTYMAPEYAVGSQQDHRSDVFAAALCLFEMLAGRPAYDATNPTELVDVVKHAEVPELESLRPDVPSDLAAIVAKATALNPDDRFPNAQELQRTLASLQVRVASDFNRERFAAWLEAARRKAMASGDLPDPDTSGPPVQTRETGVEPATVDREVEDPLPSPAATSSEEEAWDDDMREDDFADLETMAMHNPLADSAPEELTGSDDDISVAATGPMEAADPDQYRSGADTLDTNGPTLDPDASTEDVARMPTSTLNVDEIAPERLSQQSDPQRPTSEQPTATDIDVGTIRGDRREGDDKRPRILTQSGFQEELSEEEVRRIRDGSGPATLPAPPPDESTSPNVEVKPVVKTAQESPAAASSDVMPHADATTTDNAQAAHTGGRGVVNAAEIAGTSEAENPDESSVRFDSPQGGWNMPTPPPQEKSESMGRTAEGLARKFGSKYGSFSRTEKGRRTVHAAIVAVLAILFVGLLLYIFFIAV